MDNNPYVGPRSIGGSNHPGEKIYGRDQEIDDLMHLVIAERIVLLYSPSGAGKTSLLQAGLAPVLERRRRFKVKPVIRVHHEPPAEVNFDPRSGNRYALSCLISLDSALDPGERKPSTDLARMTLLDYLGEEAHCETLIFDQFEEILTVDPLDRDEKVEFFYQLGDALRVKGRWAIFAMREDYLAGMDRYANLVPTHFSNTFRLDLLRPERAMDAIRGPAEAAGVRFSEEAASALVKNLCQVNAYNDDGTTVTRPGLHVEPVQLQVVCRNLWRHLPAGTKEIGPAQLEGVSNVDAALGAYYADSVRDIAASTGVAERDLRDWFHRHLITRQNTRGQVVEGGNDSVHIRPALKPLVASHLVRSERRLSAVWYELAHDRLIKPVRDNNREWRARNLSFLQKQTELWIATNRSKQHLVSGGELKGVKTWAASHSLRPEEEEFLAACDEEQARLQEIEETAKERRRAGRLRWMVVAASLLAVFAALGVYYFFEESTHLSQKNREASDLLREARGQAARLIEEAKKQREEMWMTVLRELSIENMLDDRAAGAEVRALDPAWTVLLSGPGKLAFAIARDLGGERGRLIGVGHDGFLNYENSAGSNLFLRTAVDWLKRERTGPILVVLGPNVNDGKNLVPRLKSWNHAAEEGVPRDEAPRGKLAGASMLVLTSKLKLGDGDVEAIRKFVDAGGGLLVTGYGWVYAKYERNGGQDIFGDAAEKLLDEYPINLVMKQFGARWTNEIARAPRR